MEKLNRYKEIGQKIAGRNRLTQARDFLSTLSPEVKEILKSKSRRGTTIETKGEVVKVLRDQMKLSWPDIRDLLKLKDHTQPAYWYHKIKK